MSEKRIGTRTIQLKNPPYVYSTSSVVGKMESEGPLGPYFDHVEKDPMFGKEKWEEAESQIQLLSGKLALKKADLVANQIDYLFAGDLLGQLIATSFGVEDLNIPFFGVYGACSTMGESLSLAAMTIDGGYADKTMALTSSHNASAERQFRFPPAYGNQKPKAATWTVTGGGACVLSKDPPKEELVRKMAGHLGDEKGMKNVRVTMITTGKIMDYGIKDTMNMGGVMAPAACDVIRSHLDDAKAAGRSPEEYDRIITGDLGKVGKEILLELLLQHGYDIEKIYDDCGMMIFDDQKQDTHSGGSGCGCSAATLNGYILKRMFAGEWNRVLFVPTGALLSPISFHEGNSVPAIAHGVVFEAEKR